VTWAYRLFLGREPESEAIVRQLQREFPTTAALADSFLSSEEFRQRRRGHSPPSLDGYEGPMQIAPITSAADEQRLFAHVQTTWQQLGETEPHWSVLSSGEFKQDNLAANREQFYASGQHCLRLLAAALQRCDVDFRRLSSGIEYGCGVGRVTHWLAEHLQVLHAYDISSAHLKIAREHLEAQGRKNVVYHHVRRLDDLRQRPRVDLVYTCIVLQHNPPPIIKVLIERLLAALNPGGVAYFQLPCYAHGYSFDLTRYLAHADRVHEIEMHALPQHRVFQLIRNAGCEVLEVLDDDTWTGAGVHNLSNVFVVQKRGRAVHEAEQQGSASA
jgi:SAM-dependent methyltransferase